MSDRLNIQRVRDYAKHTLGLRCRVVILWDSPAIVDPLDGGRPGGYYRMLYDTEDYRCAMHEIGLDPSDSDEEVLQVLRHELEHARQAEGQDDGWAWTVTLEDHYPEERGLSPEAAQEAYERTPVELPANEVMRAEWRDLKHCLNYETEET